MFNKLFLYLSVQNKSKLKSGFTIVELIVVIVIICILATISYVSYSGLTKKAILVSLQSDLDGASAIITSDMISNKVYPANIDSLGLKASPNTTYTYVSRGEKRYCLSANYSDTYYHITSDNLIPRVGNCYDTTFAVTWGGSSEYSSGSSIIQTSDGGFVVTGDTWVYGAGSSDMFLAKYNSAGDLSWNKTWGGIGADMGISLVQTSDGGYAVTGGTDSYGAGNDDMALVKYDSAGNLSWSKTWGGTNYDYGKSLVQTSDGGYAVIGQTRSFGAGGDDMFLAKYDTTGNLSWSKIWGSDGGFVESLAQTSDGGYIVTGETDSFGAGGSDIFLAKYDSSGNLSWIKTWGNTGGDYSSSIVQTSDGGYAVTGGTNSYGAGSYDMALVKYDSAGNLSWSKTWGGTGYDYGSSIVQSSDGGYAVAGITHSYGAGSYDTFLVKYDSAGNLSWNKTWGGTVYDSGNDLVQANDGGYAVTGSTESYGTGGDMFLVKYNASGDIPGCTALMCQTPTATVTSPTATVFSPTATVFSPTATVFSPTATITTIVVPN